MTGEELQSDLHFLVDDETLSSEQELSLINRAYERICAKRQWRFTLQIESSQTVVAGTVSYNHPATLLFLSGSWTISLTDATTGIAAGFLKVVPMERALTLRNVQGYAYIDDYNKKIVFTSSEDSNTYAGKKITYLYHAQPSELEADDTPIFPKAYHRLISLEAARFFWYNDQQVDGGFSTKMQREWDMLFDDLKAWDEIHAGASGATNQPEEVWLPEIS